MVLHLRIDNQHAAQSRRWTMGLLVSSDCGRITGVLVESAGRGASLRAEVAGSLQAMVPAETSALFPSPSGESSADSLGRITMLRSQLAEIQAALVAELLAEVRLAPTQLLAIGVHDPGFWTRGKVHAGYLSLCDAARLAELTGQNVIDAFPARDLAASGMGGPITALAEWFLLRDRRQGRWLLDLGRTIHMTYLPADAGSHPASRIVAFDVGPGLRLLDLLAQKLTAGEQSFDPGGRLAVQGRRIPELIDAWLEDPYFKTPLPRWHPHGVRPERFLSGALRLAVDRGWSVRDLLCSATHFLVESIAQTIAQRLPEDLRVREIILTGGGQQNGMLLGELVGRLPEISIQRVEDFGLASEVLGPASVALMALLHLDQVPANHPAVTGAETCRVLGRLTPGSPQSWQRLMEEFTTARPEVRPLRSAI
jgi:anhydro-N-acetylmuramic acid kinase